MGCTISYALNYRPFAMVDDGTCVVGGCTDSELPEFEPLATFDDGSCPVVYFGCMDPLAGKCLSDSPAHKPTALTHIRSTTLTPLAPTRLLL